MGILDKFKGMMPESASVKADKKAAAEAEVERRRRATEAAEAAERDKATAKVKEITFKKGGSVRGDGIAQRGKTKGRQR